MTGAWGGSQGAPPQPLAAHHIGRTTARLRLLLALLLDHLLLALLLDNHLLLSLLLNDHLLLTLLL